jgi:hypothetical protein
LEFQSGDLGLIEKQRGMRPFEITPFMRFLFDRVEALKRHLTRLLPMRVALHRHPGVTGVMEAAEAILRAIPGLELVELHQPAVGLQSGFLGKQWGRRLGDERQQPPADSCVRRTSRWRASPLPRCNFALDLGGEKNVRLFKAYL